MGSDIPGAEYQVFLSFRGPDTRQGFADYLYHTMVDAGVRVFRDNEEIRPGEKIEEILRAINNSIVCIPIFSRGYADSKWCLRELAEMMEKKKTIMPVFYDVTPDDVKLKTHLYDDALRRHEKENDKPKWEKALKDAVEISGWESNGEEEKALKEVVKIKGWEVNRSGHAELCKLIVKEVLANLKVKDKIVTEHLVGMDEQVEIMLNYLDLQAHGVRYVGIYGIGGSGKTTLAKTLFNQLSARFEAYSFLTDVRESSMHGLEHLQRKLIHDLLPKDSRTISDTDDGIKVLRDACRNKKVLIVLDDVDKREQIESLAGSSRWYSSGSRIIITTRDINVVLIKQEYSVKVIGKKPTEIWTFGMKDLNFEQALQLFSRHAFKMDHPPTDFLDLAKEVVSVIGRLPLALEIIGSHLYGKQKEVWEDSRSMLVKIPQENIHETLMISYEALDFRTKQIFLDIACLPSDINMTYATHMWKSCGFRPEVGIKRLISQSIIKVMDDNKLWMHDHLRNLGREIICMENFADFGKHSRLWDYKEAWNVVQGKEGSAKIEVLPPLLCDDLQNCNLTDDHFRILRNLRFLQLDGIDIIGNFEYQFTKLRWLSWHSCPLNFKAINLYLRRLAILDLSNSNINEHWQGWREIKVGDSLAVLDLSLCKNISRTPDLSKYTNLERLILENCLTLMEIDGSIGNLKSLKHLNLKYCSSLRGLPKEIGYLKALQELFLGHGADPFAPLPDSIGNLRSLEILEINNVSITGLPDTIGRLEKLKRLSLMSCKVQRLPDTLGDLHSLIELDLSYSNLAQLPDSVGCLKKLERLSLANCFVIQKLPGSFGDLQSLSYLDISYAGLFELPDSVGNLEELKTIKMSSCRVSMLPRSIGMLKKLEELVAARSHLQGEIPTEIGRLSRLRILDLSGTNICRLPLTIYQLSSLETLWIETCDELEELPELPRSLISLRFASLVLKRIPNLLNLSNLTNLVLDNTEDGSLVFDLTLAPGHNAKEFEYPGWSSELEVTCLWDPTSLEQCIVVRMSNITTLPTELLGSVARLSTLLLCCLGLQWIPQLPSSLSTIVLEHLHEGTKLPCLSNLKNLSYLIFCKCSLGKDGFGSLGLRELEQLETLVVKQDSGMLDGLQTPTSLQMFELSSCAHVQKLPDLSHLTSLKVLKIKSCNALSELPDLTGSSLWGLFICECVSMKSLGFLPPVHLKILYLKGCASLPTLPDLSSLENLEVLTVEDCRELAAIPGLGALESLQKLSIVSCVSLEFLWPRCQPSWSNMMKSPKWPCFKNLQEFMVNNCDRVVDISGLGELESLRTLDISSCYSLKEVGNRFPSSLEEIRISDCASLEQLPDTSNLKNLQRSIMQGCRPQGITPCLGELSMDYLNVPAYQQDVAQWQIPSLLSYQEISGNNFPSAAPAYFQYM